MQLDRVDIFVLFLTLEEIVSFSPPFNMMLTEGLLYITFIIVMYVPSLPSFFGAFVMKGY
jgi:hypothetical protein